MGMLPHFQVKYPNKVREKWDAASTPTQYIGTAAGNAKISKRLS